MSGLNDATVTISLEALDRLRAEVRTATERAQLAMADLLERSARSDSEIWTALRFAIPVVQFAVANLPPSDAPNWPHVELRGLAEVLDRSVDPRWHELAPILAEFAREASEWETARKTGRYAEKIAQAALEGPEDTSEACRCAQGDSSDCPLHGVFRLASGENPPK